MLMEHTRKAQVLQADVIRCLGTTYGWSEDRTKLHMIMYGKGYNWGENDGVVMFLIKKNLSDKEIKETCVPFDVFSKKHNVKYEHMCVPEAGGHCFYINVF